MTDDEREAFERFWQLIQLNEEFVLQHANAPCPDASERWDEELEAAYERIKPVLQPLARNRFFSAPPGLVARAGPFVAETSHQALMFLLNPPEALFGHICALSSPEYLAIRKEAQEELRQIQDVTAAGSADKTEVRLDGISKPGAHIDGVDLNQTQKDILKAVDSTPRRGEDVALKAGYGHELVRRHLPTLMRLGLVKHKHRHGYYRP
jgi:hypothetical protein